VESNGQKGLVRGATERYKSVTASVMSGGRAMVALEEKAAPSSISTPSQPRGVHFGRCRQAPTWMRPMRVRGMGGFGFGRG
jgi:hypothetical protein